MVHTNNQTLSKVLSSEGGWYKGVAMEGWERGIPRGCFGEGREGVVGGWKGAVLGEGGEGVVAEDEGGERVVTEGGGREGVVMEGWGRRRGSGEEGGGGGGIPCPKVNLLAEAQPFNWLELGNKIKSAPPPPPRLFTTTTTDLQPK
jgi:hypothetical protein